MKTIRGKDLTIRDYVLISSSGQYTVHPIKEVVISPRGKVLAQSTNNGQLRFQLDQKIVVLENPEIISYIEAEKAFKQDDRTYMSRHKKIIHTISENKITFKYFFDEAAMTEEEQRQKQKQEDRERQAERDCLTVGELVDFLADYDRNDLIEVWDSDYGSWFGAPKDVGHIRAVKRKYPI